MQRSDDSVAPIIIKRKTIINSSAHHGGAWKVAYADFVTAMMAFFMLMWLLNATTEKQRKGLADYFSPTLSINKMLTTQLKNQDPMDPMDSASFASQLAAFSSVEQQVLSNNHLETIKTHLGSSDLLSFTNWIGKFAKVTGPAHFSGTSIDIAISMPESTERAELVVKNEAGSVIFRKLISNDTKEYNWQGEDTAGEIAESGTYQFFVETFKKDASQGETEMAAYQKVKEVQFEEGQYSIIFSGGLVADPKTISAVRD
ncbi:hypothetical protein N8760_04080 [Rhodobacteraceae bacterium]|nr:hypothetical protein [Paracoccaceae bacterium]